MCSFHFVILSSNRFQPSLTSYQRHFHSMIFKHASQCNDWQSLDRAQKIIFEHTSFVVTFVSSVRSSNSHPNLLLIHHQHPHFFRSLGSSTLDFHFLSHYSYIKAIKLYKGNHWTHLLATCIPYGYNRTSLQDSVR